MDEARQWIEDKSNEPIDHEIQKKKENLHKLFNEFSEMVIKGEIVGGLGLSRKTLDYPGADGWVHRVTSTYNKILSVLERASAKISKATGFIPATVTALILTGEIPEYKRFKVGVRENYSLLPTGESIYRNIVNIEILVSDLSFNEIKNIYDFYRNALKVTGKKRITEKQKALLAFIDDYGQPPSRDSKGHVDYWTATKEAWNLKHSDLVKYTTWEGIRKAYFGALEKVNNI